MRAGRMSAEMGRISDEPGIPRQKIPRKRLKEYALRILKLYDSLPKSGIRAHNNSSVGPAQGPLLRRSIAKPVRAKSDADFISKIEGALQELDESDGVAELLTRWQLCFLSQITTAS